MAKSFSRREGLCPSSENIIDRMCLVPQQKHNTLLNVGVTFSRDRPLFGNFNGPFAKPTLCYLGQLYRFIPNSWNWYLISFLNFIVYLLKYQKLLDTSSNMILSS